MTPYETAFSPIVSILRKEIPQAPSLQKPFLIGIDGRCASGKSTLAEILSTQLSCPVVHMDQFFLPPSMRTTERLAEPGGNVDRERFWMEVLHPLCEGLPCAYRPYDCHKQALTDVISLPASTVYIIEGTYCLHPALFDAYDLTVFLTVSYEEQCKRISHRNGETGLTVFQSKWIPLEEAYFEALDIQNRCRFSFETDRL